MCIQLCTNCKPLYTRAKPRLLVSCSFFWIQIVYLSTDGLFYCLFYLFFYCLCIVTVIAVVCREIWTLGVWGESPFHKRLFNPPPHSQGWAPGVLPCVLFVSCVYLDGGWGVEGDLYSLWLVCYKHAFHANLK